jgi:FkbM family methyltransferase
MHPLEQAARRLRHAPALRKAAPFWDGVRPVYDRLVGLIAHEGLERVMNGTDPIRIHPRHRDVPECYEPEVWGRLMAMLRPGDTFVDVGAFIGLYAVAAARRVAPGGRVVAFEPEEGNARSLREHVALNGGGVDVVEAAVGAQSGRVALAGRDSEVQVSYRPQVGGIPCVTLDEHFAGQRVDVLKVDVEGFEDEVLRGARALLSDSARRPRAVFVEVHPFAWSRTGTTSAALLATLHGAGYEARHLDGAPVDRLDRWEEIIAVPS